jgi:hypothetical protein
MVIVDQGCEEVFSAVHHLGVFHIKLGLQNYIFTISFLVAQAELLSSVARISRDIE